MTYRGICPVTNKVETVFFKAIPCGTFDNPNAFLKGHMSSCSAMDNKKCPNKECPIYKNIPDNFNVSQK